MLALTGCGNKEAAKSAYLSFDSFDGGGPEFDIVLDSDIVAFKSYAEYSKPDHDNMPGAGYTVKYEFVGVKPGETTMIVQERSPIAGNYNHHYSVKVDKKLNVTVELIRTEDLYETAKPSAMLVMRVGDNVLYAAPEDNTSAEAFMKKLSEGSILVEMHDYGNFEKVGPLPWKLPRNDEEITTKPGDIILYQGNQITIYYDQNTWDFTRLAQVTDTNREEMLEFLGSGDVTVEFIAECGE